jgi:hypothetical protein
MISSSFHINNSKFQRPSIVCFGLLFLSCFLSSASALTKVSSDSSTTFTMMTTSSTTSSPPRSTTPTPPAVVEAVTNLHQDIVDAVEAVKEELAEGSGPDIQPYHFVFGYGSLICKKSRAISAPTLADKDAIPVEISDVERVWAKRTKRGMTAMGVRFRPGAKCTGVLLPVTEAELARFDEREQGYDRYQINLDQVAEVPFLAKKNHYEKMDYEHADVLFNTGEENNSNNNSTSHDNTYSGSDGAEHNVFIWIYVQRYDCPADEDFPIAQSYVDIIMRGWMNIDQEFARHFIETTIGWSPEEVYGVGDNEDDINDSDDDEDEKKEQEEYCANLAKLKVDSEVNDDNNNNNSTGGDGPTWVDDREDPIYMRADPVFSEKKGDIIDELLELHIPEHFDNREPLSDEGTKEPL